jgi:triosephosphate isomerase
MHWEKEGAFTGAVSAGMLLDLGCRFVILGHSERRQHFGETDAAVQRKVRAALAVRLTPIVCVGETLTERDGGETLAVVARQVRAALEGLMGTDLSRLVLAYEPVWAIGTGRTATPEQAQEVHGAIRRLVGQQGDGSATRILYGGSVKAENAAALLRESDIDGALVGGASLVAEQFARIVEAARPG